MHCRKFVQNGSNSIYTKCSISTKIHILGLFFCPRNKRFDSTATAVLFIYINMYLFFPIFIFIHFCQIAYKDVLKFFNI